MDDTGKTGTSSAEARRQEVIDKARAVLAKARAIEIDEDDEELLRSHTLILEAEREMHELLVRRDALAKSLSEARAAIGDIRNNARADVITAATQARDSYEALPPYRSTARRCQVRAQEP